MLAGVPPFALPSAGELVIANWEPSSTTRSLRRSHQHSKRSCAPWHSRGRFNGDFWRHGIPRVGACRKRRCSDLECLPDRSARWTARRSCRPQQPRFRPPYRPLLHTLGSPPGIWAAGAPQMVGLRDPRTSSRQWQKPRAERPLPPGARTNAAGPRQASARLHPSEASAGAHVR